jgi:threonine/homoserine/homoserine lactone efflux protein
VADVLPSWPLLSAFLAASFILAVTPGPGVFYIVTRSVLQGKRHGIASVLGVALGNLGNAVGAAIGLAALFAISSIAFMVVKYAGAAYLIYLGVQALRAPVASMNEVKPAAAPLGRIFRDGFLVALLNPKTAIFFAIAALTDTCYALAAGAVAPMLARARGVRSLGRYLTGGAFIGLGVFTALGGPRNGK